MEFPEVQGVPVDFDGVQHRVLAPHSLHGEGEDEFAASLQHPADFAEHSPQVGDVLQHLEGADFVEEAVPELHVGGVHNHEPAVALLPHLNLVYVYPVGLAAELPQPPGESPPVTTHLQNPFPIPWVD